VSEVRYAIIGAGVIGPTHAKALAEVKGAKLVAVCDKELDRAEKLAKEYGVRAVQELADILSDKDIDAVSICTPSGMHGEMVIAALEAGKHVLTEKPMEITVEKCNAMIAAWEKSGKKFTCIFQNRWASDAQKLKKLRDEGRFGTLALANAVVPWWRTQEYYDAGGWRGTWQWDGGGALMNQSIHTIDLLQWIAGPVAEISAHYAVRGHKIETEDVAVAALKFEDGALGTIIGTTCAWPGFPVRVELFGSNGTAILERGDLKVLRFKDEAKAQGGGAAVAGDGGAADPTAIGLKGHAAQIQDFIDAILEDRMPAIDPREGKNAVAIIRAIYESSNNGGKPIRVAK
jgi:UDP-N-acetyl-2-amino-2-deoxyglucuronate dehydrogenase